MCEQDRESNIVVYHPSSYAREFTDAMQDILEMHDPLHRNLIYEKVRERGTQVGGAKPANSIGSCLKKSRTGIIQDNDLHSMQ